VMPLPASVMLAARQGGGSETRPVSWSQASSYRASRSRIRLDRGVCRSARIFMAACPAIQTIGLTGTTRCGSCSVTNIRRSTRGCLTQTADPAADIRLSIAVSTPRTRPAPGHVPPRRPRSTG
jgi:hypothetical protein